MYWLYVRKGERYVRIDYGHNGSAPRTLAIVGTSTSTGPDGHGEQLHFSRRAVARSGANGNRAAGGVAVIIAQVATKPVRAIGGFFAMSLDTFVLMCRPPFAWREYVIQTWFVARVSVLPALMLTMPYSVLLVFTFNILLNEFGAADFSGTGAAFGTVNQIGPIVTVLVVSGAGATSMCADLGARTIRDELDALRVMGINPIQALVVPRVLAATTVALALSASVIIVGLAGAFFFACTSSTSPRAHSSRA